MMIEHNGINRYPQLGSWEILSGYQKRDLASFTIVLGGIPVNGNPQYEEIAAAVRTMIDAFRQDFSTCVRKRLPGSVWRGRFEFDLRRGPITDQRGELFRFMSIPAADHTLVPHVHFVSAVEGYGKELVRTEFARAFRGPWRVYVTDLFAHQTVVEALSNLQSYVNKQRLQYCDGGIGGEGTKFHESYEDEWERVVERLYRDVPTLFKSR